MSDDFDREIGLWLRDITSPDELVAALKRIFGDYRAEVKEVQERIAKPLSTDNPNLLSEELDWFAAHLHRMGSLCADADALLDKSQKYFLVPTGQMRPCTYENGDPYEERGRKAYAKVSEADRKVELDAHVAAFRRLRNEYQLICEVLRSRLILGQKILDRLGKEAQAAGYQAGRGR